MRAEGFPLIIKERPDVMPDLRFVSDVLSFRKRAHSRIL